MTIDDLLKETHFKIISGFDNTSTPILRGFSSDMMSNAMAKGKEGDLWITFQTHMNVLAIALMKKMAGIILVQNRTLMPEALEKAKRENIPVLISSLEAFEIACTLHELGLRG